MLRSDDPIRKYEPLWGEWYIEDLIGTGSFGRVYKAFCDINGGRIYSAIKLVSIGGDTEFRQMENSGYSETAAYGYYASVAEKFREEIAIMSRLKDVPNIVRYEDSIIFHEQDSRTWDIVIRMELLESLPNYLKRMNPGVDNYYAAVEDPEQLARDIAKDLLSALQACESRNIIHRDIKETNTFVDKEGRFKLGDFGVAKHMETGSRSLSIRRGTPMYIAPEVESGHYDRRADIYSLGIMLYKLLNDGRFPFMPRYPGPLTLDDSENAFQRRSRGIDAIPAPTHGSDNIKLVVLKACAYNPDNRFADAREFMAAFNETIPLDPKGVLIQLYDKKRAELNTILVVSDSSKAKVGEKYYTIEDKKDNDALLAEAKKMIDDTNVKSISTIKAMEDRLSRGLLPPRVGELAIVPIASAPTRRKKGLWVGVAAAVLLLCGVALIIKTIGDKSLREASTEGQPTIMATEYSSEAPTAKASVVSLISSAPTKAAGTETAPAATICVAPTATPQQTAKQNTTKKPTSRPTAVPTPKPTAVPTPIPTPKPTAVPTPIPTPRPTVIPNPTPAPITPTPRYPDSDGWQTSLPSEVANNSYYIVETKTQYQYRMKETKESTSTSMPGWERYGSREETSYADNWSEWSKTKPSDKTGRQIEKKEVATEKTVYEYFYYEGWKKSDGSYWRHFCRDWLVENGYRDVSGKKTVTLNKQAKSNGTQKRSCCGKHYCFIYNGWGVYSKSKTGAKTVTTYHTEYRYRDPIIIKIYLYYRWGNWSEWQFDAVTQTDTIEVRTRTVYRWKHR